MFQKEGRTIGQHQDVIVSRGGCAALQIAVPILCEIANQPSIANREGIQAQASANLEALGEQVCTISRCFAGRCWVGNHARGCEESYSDSLSVDQSVGVQLQWR